MSDINAAVQALITSTLQQALPAIVQAVLQQLPQNAAPAATNPFTPAPAAVQQLAQPGADPFGGAAQQAVTVTPDMVQAVIMPLIANEQCKAELMAAMAAQGVQSLPDATPAQLPGLYAAFKAIEAKYTGGAQSQQQPAAAGVQSII